MDEKHRRRLELRRIELQEEVKLRSRRESVRERTDILDAHGVPYELLFEDRDTIEWVWRHFPKTGGLLSPCIDWPRVPVREVGPESDAQNHELSAWLTKVAADHGLGDCTVVLLSGNGSDPMIGVSFRALTAHPEVASCGFDVWIVCEAGGWAMEFLRFQHGWNWGRASPAESRG